jgi:hypothetical protein
MNTTNSGGPLKVESGSGGAGSIAATKMVK